MTARILATYRVSAPAGEIEARARALAAEQSVEMPVEAIRDARVLGEIVATVESIRPALTPGAAGPPRGGGRGGGGGVCAPPPLISPPRPPPRPPPPPGAWGPGVRARMSSR